MEAGVPGFPAMATRPNPPWGNQKNKEKPTRIFLKLLDSSAPRPSKKTIFETVHVNLQCYLTGLRENQNEFTAFSDFKQTIDALTSPKAILQFKNINLEPQIPPGIRAERTLFIRHIDYDIGRKKPEEIIYELQTHQKYLKNAIVTKIKDYTHVLKLTCESTEHAERALREGLVAFHFRISPSQIEKEKFTFLQICFKCYKYENHTTANCPSIIEVCSECAQSGHTHRNCTSITKKCLNCPEGRNQHRTLAPSCPAKKLAIKQKELQIQEKNEKQNSKTYSSIMKATIKETTPQARPIINLTDKTQFKLVALIIEAHVTVLTGDRPYNEIIEESLKLNYDLDVKLPNRDSQKILDMYLPSSKEPATNFKKPEPSVKPKTKKTKNWYQDSGEDSSVPPTPFSSPAKSSTSSISNKESRKRQKESPDESQKNKKQDTRNKNEYNVRIYRSKDDPNEIPVRITPEWFTAQVLGDQGEFGLKTTVFGDMTRFREHLQSEILTPSLGQLRKIDHSTFQQLQRIQQYDPQ